MSSYDYAALAVRASALIQKYGRAITVVSYNTTIADPDMPWRGPSDPRTNATETSAYGVSVEPSSARQLGFTALTDDLLKRVKSVFIVEAGSVDLLKYDEINADGETWKIEVADKLQPADTVLLYFFGVNR